MVLPTHLNQFDGYLQVPQSQTQQLGYYGPSASSMMMPPSNPAIAAALLKQQQAQGLSRTMGMGMLTPDIQESLISGVPRQVPASMSRQSNWTSTEYLQRQAILEQQQLVAARQQQAAAYYNTLPSHLSNANISAAKFTRSVRHHSFIGY